MGVNVVVEGERAPLYSPPKKELSDVDKKEEVPQKTPVPRKRKESVAKSRSASAASTKVSVTLTQTSFDVLFDTFFSNMYKLLSFFLLCDALHLSQNKTHSLYCTSLMNLLMSVILLFSCKSFFCIFVLLCTAADP